MTAFGIDFGTTNSLIAAAYDNGKEVTTVPFLDIENKLPHPSIVWYNGDKKIVGRLAKEHVNAFSGQTGHKFFSSIKTEIGDPTVYNILGREYKTYQIAADIFSHIKNYSEKHYSHLFRKNELKECILTVPVSFNGKQRANLRKAANEAGIHIKTFIHEPFAAVVWYLHRNNFIESGRTRTFLVFDWGGGTLDVTAVKYENGKLFEMSISGIGERSGDYFDEVIQNYAVEVFQQKYRISPTSMYLNAGMRDRLKYESEMNKILLSREPEANVMLGNFYNSQDLNVPVSRKCFENLIQNDIDEAFSCLLNTMKAARLHSSQIDAVLLIGGTSLIPLIQNKIRDKFGVRVVTLDNANSVIAEGAAYTSYYEYKPFLVDPIQIKLYDESLYTVFEKGTLLSNNRRKINFFCTDNRDGEARLVVCENGITKSVLNIPVSSELPKPYNHERINSEFTVDENLIINVSARGATKEEPSTTSIYDVKYGLRIK